MDRVSVERLSESGDCMDFGSFPYEIEALYGSKFYRTFSNFKQSSVWSRYCKKKNHFDTSKIYFINKILYHLILYIKIIFTTC